MGVCQMATPRELIQKAMDGLEISMKFVSEVLGHPGRLEDLDPPEKHQVSDEHLEKENSTFGDQ